MATPQEQLAALARAAAESDEVRLALGELDEEELAWLAEDPQAALQEDPDPTPPDPQAVARRDAWLRQRVHERVLNQGVPHG